MDFALMTGDQADNAQRNETVWVRELLEGGDAAQLQQRRHRPRRLRPVATRAACPTAPAAG